MNIDVSLLPSGGYGYAFPSITVKPLTFSDISEYINNTPQDDPLGKYLFDLEVLKLDDPHIMDCYVMDVDFLIFYKN